jgi:hypothetical protein
MEHYFGANFIAHVDNGPTNTIPFPAIIRQQSSKLIPIAKVTTDNGYKVLYTYHYQDNTSLEWLLIKH